MESTDSAMPLSGPGNPYLVGLQGLVGSPFFGREELLTELLERLASESSRLLVLEGPRRMGKTALLHQLAVRLSEVLVPVYFDLGGRSSQPMPLLVRDLAAEVLTATGSTPPARRRLEDVGQAHRLLLQALQDALQRRRVVILFDEFDVPAEPLSPDAAGRQLYPYLQELSALEAGPSFVVARGRTREELFESAALPLFQAAPVLRLSALTGLEARRLLVEPSQGHCVYHEQAIKAIFDQTGRHPYLLNLMAAELYDLPRRHSLAPLGVLEVMACVPRALEAGRHGLEWMWEGLSAPEQRVAAAIALSNPLVRPVHLDEVREVLRLNAPDLTDVQLSDALRGLEEYELIRRDAPARYSCSGDLLRRWIAHQHPLSVSRAPDLRPARAEAPPRSPGSPRPEEASEQPPSSAGAPAEPAPLRAPRPATPDRDPVEDLWSAADSLLARESAAEPVLPPSARRARTPLAPPPVRHEVENEPLPPPRFEPPASDPDPAPVIERLLQAGHDHFLQGRLESSIEAYRRVLELEPGHPGASLGLASMLMEARAFEEALQVLQPVAALAPEASLEASAEIYLRWLDSVEVDEGVWSRVIDEALRRLPEHQELLERKRGAPTMRVRRLLAQGRAVEAAAALGALGPQLSEALPEVQAGLLQALELLARHNDADADPLLVILRRLLPEPHLAWERYLDPLLEEAERLERFSPEQAEGLLRRGENMLHNAGVDAGFAPATLRERFQAALKRIDERREREAEARLTELLISGDLDRAEGWLEELLLRRRAPQLEEKLRSIRNQRQLIARYHAALQLRDQRAYDEAQRLLAQVVGESPAFIGPDGKSAIDQLDAVTTLKLGSAKRRSGARRPWALALSAMVLGSLLTGGTLFAWSQHQGGFAWGPVRLAPIDLALQPMSGELRSPLSLSMRATTMAVQSLENTPPRPQAPAPAVAPGLEPAPAPLPAVEGSDRAVEPAVVRGTVAGSPMAAPDPMKTTPGSSSSPSVQASGRQPAPQAVAGPARPAPSSPAPRMKMPKASTPVAAASPSSPPDRVSLASPRPPMILEKRVSAPVAPVAPTLPARPSLQIPSAQGGDPVIAPRLPGASASAAPATATLPAAAVAALPVPERDLADEPLDAYRAGLEAMRAGRSDEAFASLRRALAENPTRAEVYVALGDLHIQQGRTMDALRSYQQATRLDRSLIRAWHALGKLHQTRGHREEAIEALQRVAQLDANGELGRDARNRLNQMQQPAATSSTTWMDGSTSSGPVRLFQE